MKKSIIPILGALLLAGHAAAQDDIPLLRPEERQAVDAQTDEFNQALAPVLTDAARSTVRVWAGKRRLAYGTVIGDGHKVLTKWSEIARAGGNLRVESAAGEVFNAKVSGVYQDDDLAVLETTGTALVPVKWSLERPRLGTFLAAPQPDGRPAAFGVVSVLERNLRQTDRAYLGVGGDRKFDGPGVRIGEIYPQSGAESAGLKPGDIIMKVGERTISGVLELQNSLIGINPGSTIALRVRTGGVEKKIDVLLGKRPNLYNPLGGRLQQMERMGGEISRVRDSFPSALQTDMRVGTDQVGGPVVDLQGRVLGITLARADRTRSFIMPAAAIEELLKKDPQDPTQAQVRNDNDTPDIPVRKTAPHGRTQPANPERMRQHLSEMQRLMDFMREEMEDVESGER